MSLALFLFCPSLSPVPFSICPLLSPHPAFRPPLPPCTNVFLLLLPSASCVTVTFDKLRGQQHFPFACPFDGWCSHQWLFLTERLSGEAKTHMRVSQPHTAAWSFLVPFFFFFPVKKGTPCDIRLMAYWICHISLSQLAKLKLTDLLYQPHLDLFPPFRWTAIQ